MQIKLNLQQLSLMVTCLLILVLSAPCFAIERRKDQSPREAGYAFAPYAMAMPGIGQFYGFAGVIENINGSETDAYIATMVGDLRGFSGSVIDIPLYNEHVTLNYFFTHFTKAGIETFERGMFSDAKRSKIVVSDKVQFNNLMFNYKTADKQLQFYFTLNQGVFHPDYILDENSTRYDLNIPSFEELGGELGVIIDETDDRNDPRVGYRIETRLAHNPRRSSFNSNFFRLDLSMTGYIPVGERDAWAFNIFRSDSIVTAQGEQNTAAIESYLGIVCNPGDPAPVYAACLAELALQVEQTRLANTNGLASRLGGALFLRSYPQGRFSAAHTLFMGAEYRWNFSEQSEPFDIFFAKGIQTASQIAFFAEQGTVSETMGTLGAKWAHSVGAGYRVLLASGMVFRFDLATGEEGVQATLFFNYPWGVFN